MQPFFSIITINLNSGDLLEETYKSVSIQSFKDFEYIIKDGFSTDESGSFLRKISSNSKLKIITKKDSGIYDAMNQSLYYAKGKYVLFLNAGDFFYDNTVLSSFYETVVNNNNPGLTYCDYITTGNGEYVQSPSRITNFFLFRTMLCHQVCMIKTELYSTNNNFDTCYKVDADYDFLLHLLIHQKVNYKHFQKLGIISTSNGYSYQNSRLAKKEVALIRKKYFGKKYIYYTILLGMTLPLLREKLVRKNNFISRIYQRLVNLINRFY